MSTATRKQLVERWGERCAPEMLLSPSPFGLVDGRQDFRGFRWQGTFNEFGFSSDVFLPAGQKLDNLDLSYADISPFKAREMTMSNCHAKQAKFTVCDWAHSTLTHCEFERCKIDPGMTFIAATVTHCVFRACTYPELFAHGTRYDHCQAINMRLNGPLGGSSDNPLITNTTVSGKWKELSAEEKEDGTQLTGCDFSDVEFGICSFEYVDMNKVKIPADIKKFTVTNWQAVRDTINAKLQDLKDSSTKGEEPYRQASFALDMLEDDLRGFHENTQQPRGARYCTELNFAPSSGHSHNYLPDLYLEAGAEFMIDPTTEKDTTT